MTGTNVAWLPPFLRTAHDQHNESKLECICSLGRDAALAVALASFLIINDLRKLSPV